MNDEQGIRLAIHDASRLEWVAVVPLPQGQKPAQFNVEFELEIPAHLYVGHDQWRSLQVLTRLQSPLERGGKATGHDQDNSQGSPDALRELALATAHRVKTLRQHFARECFMANSLLALAPTERRLHSLLADFEAVCEALASGRRTLDAWQQAQEQGPRSARSEGMRMERLLVDEFLSNQLLDFLFHARRAIDEHLLRDGGPHTEVLREVARGFEQVAQDKLKAELIYREQMGFITPSSDRPDVLERYLERASLLKKHFQELLFLRQSQEHTDTKLRDFGAVFGAMGASFFGFGLNSGLVSGWTAHAGLGLFVAAFAGAAIYAVQDRIKEMGKTYLGSALGKYYAQRITKYSLPQRKQQPKERKRSAPPLAKVHELMRCRLDSRPDPLNPELGVVRDVYVLKYVSRGVVQPSPELRGRGIACMKQAFRYDLSWLLPRLDDATKSVPVVQADGQLRLAEAARCYRLPATVRLVTASATHTFSATAVMHKRGLERFELESAASHERVPSGAAEPAMARV